MMFFYVLPCSCCFFFLVLFYFIGVLYFFYVSLPQVNTNLDIRGKNKAITSTFYDHLSLFKYSKKEGQWKRHNIKGNIHLNSLINVTTWYCSLPNNAAFIHLCCC